MVAASSYHSYQYCEVVRVVPSPLAMDSEDGVYLEADFKTLFKLIDS